jgi:TetR/AcrR family transcriptional repressor of nem operon
VARPKEFEPEVALDAAIELFRRQGYEATSVQDLVDAMGIHRGSLYDTFGDKHDLYLAALDRYDQRKYEETCALLRPPGSKVAAFHRLFANIIDQTVAYNGNTFGCLITNSSVERAPIDPSSAERAARNFTRTDALYMETLTEARAEGEIMATDEELRALARFLISSVKGLRVTAKAECRRETLEDIARVALSVLDRYAS